MTVMQLAVVLEEIVLKQQRQGYGGDDDPEVAHYEADQALLKYVGNVRVTAAFKAIRKWYA